MRTAGRVLRRRVVRPATILGLALLFVVLGVGGCGPRSSPRVLVLGLDGIDWAIVDRGIAEGDLPNFARVVRGGVRAPLISLEDFEKSPVIWTSLLTGVPPERHGIVDFVSTDPATGQAVPVSSGERRVPAIWNMLTQAGRTVTVLGMWATFPAEEVEGTIVSDRFAFLASKPRAQWGLTPEIAARLVYPAERLAEFRTDLDAPTAVVPDPIRQSLGRLTDVRTAEPHTFLADVPDRHADDVYYLKQTYLEDRLKELLARRLLEETPTDLMIHYFRGADVAEHFFWRYWEPGAFGAESAPPRFARLIPEYYRYLDDILGLHLEALRPDDSLVIVSDHGQRARSDFEGQLNWTDDRRDDRWRRRSERLFRALGLQFTEIGVDRGLSGVRYGESWGKDELTLALDPRASELPPDALRREVIARVESIVSVADGNPLFRLAEPEDPLRLHFEADVHRIRADTVVRVRGEKMRIEELFQVRQRSGDHRREGVFVGYGRGFPSDASEEEVSVFDVTPLLLALLDVPLPLNRTGRVPLDVLNDDLAARASLVDEFDYEAGWERSSGNGMTDEAFVEQLRALGYVD